MREIKLVYMASDAISVPLLKRLAEEGGQKEEIKLKLAALVTNPDRPYGRKHKLKATAAAEYLEHAGQVCENIPVYKPQSPSSPEFIEIMQKIDPDIIVTFAYGSILSKEFLAVPALPPLNIHVSRLPLYRGAAPVYAAIKNRDERTAISLMQMSEGLDEGPVYEVFDLPIATDDTRSSLREKAALLAAKKVPEFLVEFAGGEMRAREQKHADAVYSPKIKKEDRYLNTELSAPEFYALQRALEEKPGAVMQAGGQNKRIFKTAIVSKKEMAAIAADKGFDNEVDLRRSLKRSQITVFAKRIFLALCPDQNIDKYANLNSAEDYAAVSGLKAGDSDKSLFFIEIKELQSAAGKRIKAADLAHNIASDYFLN